MKNSRSNITILFSSIFLTLAILAGCASTAKPGTSDQAVTVWANEALMTTFTYDFANYQRQFKEASQYYTPEAWANYLEALRISKNLVRVEKEQMAVAMVLQGAPTILGTAVVNDRFTWKVQAPVLLTYQNAKSRSTQTAVVTLMIVRANAELGVRGLAIDQLLIQASPIKKEKVLKQKVITTKEEISG